MTESDTHVARPHKSPRTAKGKEHQASAARATPEVQTSRATSPPPAPTLKSRATIGNLLCPAAQQASNDITNTTARLAAEVLATEFPQAAHNTPDSHFDNTIHQAEIVLPVAVPAAHDGSQMIAALQTQRSTLQGALDALEDICNSKEELLLVAEADADKNKQLLDQCLRAYNSERMACAERDTCIMSMHMRLQLLATQVPAMRQVLNAYGLLQQPRAEQPQSVVTGQSATLHGL